MRARTIDLLRAAREGGYAVPAFDYGDLWDALGIVRAAEQSRSPVILMTLPVVSEQAGIRANAGLLSGIAEESSVPVALHVDHAAAFELCERALFYGYDSVMIDASQQPLEENIRQTAAVTALAHRYGRSVEAEIGHIKGKNIEASMVEGERYLADVDEAVRLLEETDVDFLAVGVGTAHGFYTEEPHIHFDRLAELNAALGIPLVLHGGTGVPAEMVREAVQTGISKVNVGTDILTTFSNAIRRELVERGENAAAPHYMPAAVEAVAVVARGWMKTCMSSGKA